MSKSNATETALLEYIFTAAAPAWDAATDLDIHLHTADPGEAGNYLPSTKTLRPRVEFVTAARISAHLSGSSRLTARLDYEIDPDVLAAELAQLLLLDLV